MSHEAGLIGNAGDDLLSGFVRMVEPVVVYAATRVEIVTAYKAGSGLGGAAGTGSMESIVTGAAAALLMAFVVFVIIGETRALTKGQADFADLGLTILRGIFIIALAGVVFLAIR